MHGMNAVTTSKQTEEVIPEKKMTAVNTAQRVTPKKEKATPQNSPEKKLLKSCQQRKLLKKSLCNRNQQ